MDTELDALEKKHRKEMERFVEDCPHTDISVEDNETGFRQRTITIRCNRCRLNLAGYTRDGNWSYMSYVRDCVNGHPHSRKSK